MRNINKNKQYDEKSIKSEMKNIKIYKNEPYSEGEEQKSNISIFNNENSNDDSFYNDYKEKSFPGIFN